MKLRIFLSICIFTASLVLFIGCGTNILPPPKTALGIPAPPKPQAFVFAGMKTITQAWDSYKADRIKEGYTLLDVRASQAWLEKNADNISINIKGNSLFNHRTVIGFTSQRGNRVKNVLVVNDDVGNQRVFQQQTATLHKEKNENIVFLLTFTALRATQSTKSHTQQSCQLRQFFKQSLHFEWNGFWRGGGPNTFGRSRVKCHELSVSPGPDVWKGSYSDNQAQERLHLSKHARLQQVGNRFPKLFMRCEFRKLKKTQLNTVSISRQIGMLNRRGFTETLSQGYTCTLI